MKTVVETVITKNISCPKCGRETGTNFNLVGLKIQVNLKSLHVRRFQCSHLDCRHLTDERSIEILELHFSYPIRCLSFIKEIEDIIDDIFSSQEKILNEEPSIVKMSPKLKVC